MFQFQGYIWLLQGFDKDPNNSRYVISIDLSKANKYNYTLNML